MNRTRSDEDKPGERRTHLRHCHSRALHRVGVLQESKNHETHKIELRNRPRKCLYLYFYYIDKEFGFMHIKLQTWFPFEIQIYINGREHLAKMLDQEGIGYRRYDNCFLQIDNLERAQELFDGFVERKLSRTFDALAHRIHSFLKRIEIVASHVFCRWDSHRQWRESCFANQPSN